MRKDRKKGLYTVGMLLAISLYTCAFSVPSFAEEMETVQIEGEQTEMSENDEDTPVPGWHETEDGMQYLDEDLQYVTGWQVIDNAKYYFDEDGIMQTGWQAIDNAKYYFDEDGIMQTGWQVVDNTEYCFDEDGVMLTGLQRIEDEDGVKIYLFSEDGVMCTGLRQFGGHIYYFHKTGEAATGWLNKKGNRYYMNADGEALIGWQLIGGQYYYFAESAEMQTGWLQYKNRWYYLDDKGRMKTGWLQYKNRWYYLDENGRMWTGWLQYKNKWYYLDANGRMKTGWLQHKKNWYFLGSDGKMKTGWLENRKQWYFFGADGIMIADRQKTLAGKTYYFDDQGVMLSGKVIEDGDSLYYIQNDGTIRKTEGWFKENDQVYLVGTGGKLTINKLAKYDGSYYYLRPTGIGEYLRNQTAARVAASLGCDLKAAMKYAGGLTYAGKDYFTDAWGTKRLANYGFANRSGNCYVYAAVFAELAYAMGYDAHQVRGCIRLSWGWGNNHSWVEIYKDGKTYVCDPAGLNQLGMDHAYMFHYGDKGTWMYKDQFEIIYE